DHHRPVAGDRCRAGGRPVLPGRAGLRRPGRGWALGGRLRSSGGRRGAGAAGRVTLADQAILFLPAILVAALGGRGPSLAAAALSVAAFDFFFVPPRLTFAVSDARSLIT